MLMKPCPECKGKPILCEPNYADEGGTMVVCEDCDFAGDSFVLGQYGEGRDQAIEAWNTLERNVIELTTGYQLIKDFYGERKAERSQVPLINHINEGIEILDRLGADLVVKEAFAVHPLFQADDDLVVNFFQCDNLNPLIVLYAMEYRNIANNFLSDKVEKGPDAYGREAIYSKHPVKLSPLTSVNMMLIADKVQNRKDFLAYHKGTHRRSDELEFYFNLWLRALGITEDQYQELTKGL